jgi:ribosomal protein S27E
VCGHWYDFFDHAQANLICDVCRDRISLK